MMQPQRCGLPFSWSLIKSHMDTQPQTRQADWDEFLAYLATPFCVENKNTAPGWLPAIFNGKGRHNDDVLFLNALVLDLDGKKHPYTLEAIQKGLKGFRYAAHTTYSHTPEKPCWRVVVPIDPIDPADLTHAFATLERITGLVTDRACRNPARLFYSPIYHPDRGNTFVLAKSNGKTFNYLEFSSYSVNNTTDNPIYSNSTYVIGVPFIVPPKTPVRYKRELPEGKKQGWKWPEDVTTAIENSPALRVGERNSRWQLNLTRALLRCNVKWDRTRLWLVFRYWYCWNNHATIGTPLQLAWKEFYRAFLLCPDLTTGFDVDRCRKEAQQVDLPFQASKLKPRLRLLFAACICLQRWHGQDPFFITYEHVGLLLGVSKRAGVKSIRKLIALGYLEQVSQGSNLTHKANTYRVCKGIEGINQ